MMTVGQLIEQLNEFDPGLWVFIEMDGFDGDHVAPLKGIARQNNPHFLHTVRLLPERNTP